MSPRKSKSAASDEQIEIPSRNVDGAKRAVLDKAVGDILKRYGDGSIMRMGDVAAFVDMEHALDPVYAARVGVDIDNLLVSQPDTGEQALEITETLVRS